MYTCTMCIRDVHVAYTHTYTIVHVLYMYGMYIYYMYTCTICTRDVHIAYTHTYTICTHSINTYIYYTRHVHLVYTPATHFRPTAVALDPAAQISQKAVPW